jgi:hypothetical protein
MLLLPTTIDVAEQQAERASVPARPPQPELAVAAAAPPPPPPPAAAGAKRPAPPPDDALARKRAFSSPLVASATSGASPSTAVAAPRAGSFLRFGTDETSNAHGGKEWQNKARW